MTRLIRTVLMAGTVAAATLFAVPETTRANDYWDGYWGWYNNSYRPYYHRHYYRYNSPYYYGGYYGRPYYGGYYDPNVYGYSQFGRYHSLQLGPMRFNWR